MVTVAIAEAVVELGLDSSELDRDLREVEGSFDQLEEASQLELELETTDAMRELDQLEGDLEGLDDLTEIEVELDTADASRELDRLEGDLDDLADAEVVVEADADQALREVGRLEGELEGLEDEAVVIEADAADALQEVEELAEGLEELEAEPIELALDAEQALGDVEAVQEAVDGIAAEPIEVELELDEEQAGGALSSGIAAAGVRSSLAASSTGNFLGEVIGNVAGQVASDSMGGELARGLVRNAPAFASAGATAGRTFISGLSASTLVATAGVAAVGLAAAKVFQVGFTRGIAELERQDQISRSLQAIVGDVDIADAVAAELEVVARSTAFTNAEVLQLGTSLAAVAPQLGIDLAEVDTAVLRLADTAAFAGLGMADLNEIVRALSQGASAGKLNMEDFRQVLDRIPALGPQIKQALADDLGIGIEDLNDAIAGGLITSEALVAVLLEVETTMGLAAAQAATFSGVMSNLTASIDQGFAQVLRDSGLNQALGELFDPTLIASIADGFAAVFSVVAELVASLAPTLGPTVEIVSELAQGIASVLGPALSLVGSIVSLILVPALRALQFVLEPVVSFVELAGSALDLLAVKIRETVSTIAGVLGPLANAFPGFDEILGLGESSEAAELVAATTAEVEELDGALGDLEASSPTELTIDADTQQALDEIDRLEQSITELLSGGATAAELDLDVRLGGVDFFDGLTRDLRSGLDVSAAEVALAVAEYGERYEAALQAVDEADTLGARIAAQLSLEELESELAVLANALAAQGFDETNIRQLLNEFGASPAQIDEAVGQAVAALQAGQAEIAEQISSGMDLFRRGEAAATSGPSILDPLVGDLEAGEAELIAVQQRIASSFGILPETGYGFPEEDVAALQERIELAAGGFGDLEEAAADVLEELGDLDLAEPLELDRSEVRQLVSAYADGGEDSARAYIESMQSTAARLDTVSAFRLDGLDAATELSLSKINTVDRAAAALGLSGARITQGGISFSTNITVTGQQSIRTIEQLVRAAEGRNSSTTRQTSRTSGGNSFE